MPDAAEKRKTLRTCAGCRRRRTQGEMVRLVSGPEGEIVFDLDNRLPGRGSYVCPSTECLQALRPAAVAHVLKSSVSLPAYPDLRDTLSKSIEEKVRNLLSIARKAGQAALGTHAVKESLARGRAALVLYSSDRNCERHDRCSPDGDKVPSLTLPCNAAELGRIFGQGPVKTVTIRDPGLAARLRTLHDRLTAISLCNYHGN